jgi:hypothetical protein
MRRFRAILLASVLTLSVVSPPPRVSAQVAEEDVVERFDSKKFVDYAGCAIAIGFASGTGAWLLAGLACYRAFAEHWTT